jgi:predicted aspartyl protease
MLRKPAIVALALACTSSHPRPAPPPQQPPANDRASVALHVEGNRPYIDVRLEKTDGTARTARFVVDTGGGPFLVVEPLARELGVALGETFTEQGSTFAKVTPPLRAKVGDFALELDPTRILVPVGKPVPMPVSNHMGFPRTEIEVDGKVLGFLLDTGASFTIVSQALLESWGKAHPDWERHRGAHGEAATLGGRTIETMYVEGASWHGNALGRFGVVSQPVGAFEQWMSSMMTAPIVGALAGNVLEQFRVELDYRGQKLYLSRPRSPASGPS